MPKPLDITAHGELEVVITRTFDAPRPLVFDAWTRPELLQQWLGVRGGWTLPICEVDLRVGGAYRYLWRHRDGQEMGVGGVYREIVVPERIVATERFDDPWYEGEALVTNVFAASGGRTTSTLTLRYASTAARDMVLASPMETGLEEGFQGLDALLATGAATPAAEGTAGARR